jgi:hypothetical protein
LIDKVWLQKKWLNFIRPKEEENLVSPDHTIYVSDFYLVARYTRWSVSAKKNGCAFAKSIQEIR